MRRRDFITLVGGAAVASPLLASAEDLSKVYRIGLLSVGAPLSDKSPLKTALIRGLAQTGPHGPGHY